MKTRCFSPSRIGPAWERLWRWLDGIPQARALRLACGLWVLLAVIAATIVAVQPDRRTVTPEYQMASEKWWSGNPDIYREQSGYLYLPQFAILYTPFERLPLRVGEPLWRLVMLGMLAGALFAASRRFAPGRAEIVFLVATVLVLPSALASARNGQTNFPLAALYLWTAVMLADRRWGWAAFLLTLSLAMKPISVVPVLLVGALYPKARLPLVAGLAALAVLPFLHPSPAYVWGQYQDFANMLMHAGRPEKHNFSDIAGMLRVFGMPLPESVSLLVRVVAAVATLGLAHRALKVQDAARGAFTMLLLAAVYLMLFNPRTETNSYIILGAFVGFMGAYAGLVTRDLRAAALLVALAVSLGIENYGNPIYPWTNTWLKPLATTVFGVWFAVRLLRPSSGETAVLPAAQKGA